MTTSNPLSFKLQAGPLNNLKPITVSIVEGSASGVTPDAYIKLDCRRGRDRSDFGDAEIIGEPDHFVAVAKEEKNRYSGIYVEESRRPRVRVHCVRTDRLSNVWGGDIAFVKTLAVAGRDGARSAMIDCDNCFKGGFTIDDEDLQTHQMISTMVYGVFTFVDSLNKGEIDSSVDNIVLAMNKKSLAVWKQGCDLYLRCFDELTPKVRSLNDRLTELSLSIRKLDAFMETAAAMISSTSGLGEINEELGNKLGNIEVVMNKPLDLARTEKASLTQELQQVKSQLDACDV